MPCVDHIQSPTSLLVKLFAFHDYLIKHTGVSMETDASLSVKSRFLLRTKNGVK